MKMQQIDLQNWDRKSLFDFYNTYADPLFNITAEVDVTTLKKITTENRQSFFLCNLHKALQAINAIDVFKVRMVDRQPVQLEMIHGGSTFLFEDNSFGFCYFKFQYELKAFIQDSQLALSNAKRKKEFQPQDDRIDLVHFSTLPWINFTSFRNARKSAEMDYIPKIVFGKYIEKQGRWYMPVAVEVHHGLIDGYHVSQFLENYQIALEQGI